MFYDYDKIKDIDPAETQEWIESLDAVLANSGVERTHFLLEKLHEYARRNGVRMPYSPNTNYLNTIPVSQQKNYPGDRSIERRIKSIIRWNAMAMVVKANRNNPGLGGHISTYASAATLYEVGFNHFFRGRTDDYEGDLIFFQGHASPGIYARAFLEGRFPEEQLHNFRRELAEGGGLSSYPHPWLMPDFWQFATVSMGLGPIQAIYQARFMKYMYDRGLMTDKGRKVWAFLGDGEMDEPESLGAITLASREQLDNLIFVINCNMQRLDGPVRGNAKIVQELEGAFRGAGWNVIKVVWGSEWDALLENDHSGLLARRMEEIVDGDSLKYVVEGGAYIREHFFGKYPELKELVAHMTDEDLYKLKRGGHDPAKVYSAYAEAVEHQGQPTVVLASTVKGYGLGEAGEGRNISHQQKKLNDDELRHFRDRFAIPISDEDISQTPFYKPAPDSEEMRYIQARRKAQGGPLPARSTTLEKLKIPALSYFKSILEGTGDREVSTTMVFVRMLTIMLKDKNISDRIVPIIPDEARTFGMDPLFRQLGIYSHAGQLYDPVDSDQFLYYREDVKGQILEEGITEAGATSSFLAAGMSYSTHGKTMIPFYIFYSMFGFQRVGDLFWAGGDMRVKGFLLGATSGRTTLAGEGLQHQDGHSLLLASTIPNLKSYDPGYAYEVAVIIQDGLRRMYEDDEQIFYYLSLENENYPHPEMPKGSEAGIIKGMYLRHAGDAPDKPTVQLLGSGAISREVEAAALILLDDWGVNADVWSVTSFTELRRDACNKKRWNRLHPGKKQKKAYVTEMLEPRQGPIVAASDYVKMFADQISPWMPRSYAVLGTDGFGRSETRESLRDFFEVDRHSITIAALYELAMEGTIPKKVVSDAIKKYGLNPDSLNPATR